MSVKCKREIVLRGVAPHTHVDLESDVELVGGHVFGSEETARQFAVIQRRAYREMGNGDPGPSVRVFERTIRADRLVLVVWVVTVRPRGV